MIENVKYPYRSYSILNGQCSPYIKTSYLIWSQNSSIGFHMKRALAFYGLNLSRFWPIGCDGTGDQVNKKSSILINVFI